MCPHAFRYNKVEKSPLSQKNKNIIKAAGFQWMKAVKDHILSWPSLEDMLTITGVVEAGEDNDDYDIIMNL